MFLTFNLKKKKSYKRLKIFVTLNNSLLAQAMEQNRRQTTNNGEKDSFNV